MGIWGHTPYMFPTLGAFYLCAINCINLSKKGHPKRILHGLLPQRSSVETPSTTPPPRAPTKCWLCEALILQFTHVRGPTHTNLCRRSVAHVV